MRIRLNKADLLEWLNDMPDDMPLITVRFTTDGKLLAIEVEGLEEWLWPHQEQED